MNLERGAGSDPAQRSRFASDRLGERTWPEIAAAPPLLMIPIGSTEQHGPHLPLDTDTRIAVAVAERLTATRPDAALDAALDLAVAPALAITASGEHDGFAGTLSIGTDVMTQVLIELTRSADAFAGVVWLNAHGGNTAALTAARTTLIAEGRDVLSLACWVPNGDAHAGRTETSLMLAIAPELVRLDLVTAGATEPWPELRPRIMAGGVHAVSPSGVLGDPTGATAEEGARLFDELVDRLAAELVEGSARLWSNGSP